MGSELRRRSEIFDLEEAMVGMDPDFKEGLEHYFGYKTYAREMTLEAGNLVVGKIHRFPCINILSKGVVQVAGEFEGGTYTAPYTWVSCAGSKRAIVALEDCIWTTVHSNPSNTQDLSVLESEIIASDYNEFILEQGMSQADVDDFVWNTEDRIPFDEPYSVFISESPIDGVGMFSSVSVCTGDLICPAKVGDKRTPADRYINHGIEPNVAMVMIDDDIWVQAVSDILVGSELVVNYRAGPRHIGAGEDS